MNRGTFWIGFVLALLAGNAVAMAIMISNTRDPTDHVVPDYYRRAVTWDATAAARAASAELGWVAAPTLTTVGPGRAHLRVSLRDADGVPITGATIDGEVRHRSAARGTAIGLAEAAPGYATDLELTGHGLYVVELHVTRGDDRFVTTTTVELGAP